MKATSPALNIKPRTEAEAMFDVEDRRHRQALGELLCWLQGKSLWAGHHCDAVGYAIEQLDKHAAARILERNKDGP